MNGNPKIKARVRIENGKLATKANASRLVVRGRKDISKTVHVRGFTFTPEYRELYVVMLEPNGYIWREVKHGMGINGHHPSLRDLVKTTVCQGYEIEVLPAPIPLSELNPLATDQNDLRRIRTDLVIQSIAADSSQKLGAAS